MTQSASPSSVRSRPASGLRRSRGGESTSRRDRSGRDHRDLFGVEDADAPECVLDAAQAVGSLCDLVELEQVFDQSDARVEGGVGGVGRAGTLQPSGRLVGELPVEVADEARLADAALTADQDHLAVAAARVPRPQPAGFVRSRVRRGWSVRASFGLRGGCVPMFDGSPGGVRRGGPGP